eukprot:Nitzschia sp. Nitz4//scaffold166_size90379//44053//44994//NITZ4_005058-RA/size90379-augustus-gene-0.3-mRNA-1//1//CDS//3329538199//7064//frame0
MNATKLSSSMLTMVRRSYRANFPAQARMKSTSSTTVSAAHISERNMFGRLWDKYTAALMARPLLVKATTASTIFFISDSVTQYLMDPLADYDFARAGSGAAFGVVATTWLHYWWGFLEGFVGKRLPLAQYRLQNTLAKVFLDQAIGAPLYIFTYYVVTNFIQQYNALPKDSSKTALSLLDETAERAVEMLPPTMLRHWTLWPAVHTLNFYYSPLHHRVLVQNMVLVGWSGYLSHLNNGGLMTPTEEVEEVIAIKRRETQLPLSERAPPGSLRRMITEL